MIISVKYIHTVKYLDFGQENNDNNIQKNI